MLSPDLRSSDDALVLYQAARQQIIPVHTAGLTQAQQMAIAPGDVFVWLKGSDNRTRILRWADGRRWGPLRRSLGLTLSDEVDINGKVKDSPDALTRVVHNVIAKSHDDGNYEDWRLVAYNSRTPNLAALHYVSMDPLLSKVVVPDQVFLKQTPRSKNVRSSGGQASLTPPPPPPITPNTQPRYRTRVSQQAITGGSFPLAPAHRAQTPASPPLAPPEDVSVDVFKSNVRSEIDPQPTSPSKAVLSITAVSPITAPSSSKSGINLRKQSFKVLGETYSFNHFSSADAYPLSFGPPEIPPIVFSQDIAPTGLPGTRAITDGDVYTHEYSSPSCPGEVILACWVRIDGLWQSAAQGTDHPTFSSMKLRIRSNNTPNWVLAGSLVQYKYVDKRRKRDEMERGSVAKTPARLMRGAYRKDSPSDEVMRDVGPHAGHRERPVDGRFPKIEEDADELPPPPNKRARTDSSKVLGGLQPVSAPAPAPNTLPSGGIIAWAKSIFTLNWAR